MQVTNSVPFAAVHAEPAAPLFTPEAINAMSNAGEKFCRADTDRAFALHEFMRAVGDAPTYDGWMAARAAYVTGYLRTKPQANEDAQAKSWSRFVQSLRDYANEGGFDFKVPEKPKAETPAAEAMRKSRANAYAEMSTEDRAAAIKDLTATVAKAPTKDAADALAKALAAQAKADKEAAKAKEKAEGEATKKRRDAVRDYIKGCPTAVLQMFEYLMDATAECNSAQVQMAAWNNMVAAKVAISAKALETPKRTRKAK